MARVLLADDDASARDLMARTLSADGHQVATADNGAEALAKLAGGFDVLLTDVEMPEMDGLALATAALATHPGLRVILMSGHASGLEKAAPLKDRLAARLTKPIAPETLRAAVTNALK
jgi:two-component system, cell cycle response regulator CpdR